MNRLTNKTCIMTDIMTLRTATTVHPPDRPSLAEWQRQYRVGTRCDQTDTRWQDFDLDRRHERLTPRRTWAILKPTGGT